MKAEFYNPYRDGITQSLLATWMECRQKARYYLQGYVSKSVPLSIITGTVGHGALYHVYEGVRTGKYRSAPSRPQLNAIVALVEKTWLKENPSASKQMLQDLELATLYVECLLPAYFDYWSADFKKLQWSKLEGDFKVGLKCKRGTVPVRGRMDGAFRRAGLWLFETKFKSMINEADIIDTLSLDLQVHLYLWALQNLHKLNPSGTLYNVVRRPGLILGKTESLPQYAKRIEKDIAKRPDWYFYRYEVIADKAEMDKWYKKFVGMVEEFLDWWEGKAAHYDNPGSCITKYGRCWGLTPCVENNYHNLTKRKTVFRELEDV